MEIILQSRITCPTCGHQAVETMPAESCQIAYRCENCETVLRPLPGDCCVFCSYGDTVCPPIQIASLTGGAEF